MDGQVSIDSLSWEALRQLLEQRLNPDYNEKRDRSNTVNREQRSIRKQKMEQYKGKCQSCGAANNSNDPHHIHHDLPLEYGGCWDDAAKMTLLCSECHTRVTSRYKEMIRVVTRDPSADDRKRQLEISLDSSRRANIQLRSERDDLEKRRGRLLSELMVRSNHERELERKLEESGKERAVLREEAMAHKAESGEQRAQISRLAQELSVSQHQVSRLRALLSGATDRTQRRRWWAWSLTILLAVGAVAIAMTGSVV